VVRCKSTFQGDRCKLPRFHENGQLGTTAQPLHAGAFSVWGMDGELRGVSVGSRIAHKRNRVLNRTSRFLVTSPEPPKGVSRQAIIDDLTKLHAFYGGKESGV
jgi:hypothetical protein